jgi:hypothetical protein
MKQSITRKSDLTFRQRWLVDEMQRLRFGCIEHFLIRNGEPVFESGLTQCLRRIRIKGNNRPHPASTRPDTVLKAEAVELLAHFREIGHGLVRSLTVHDGLPADLVIEEEPGDFPGAAVPSTFLPGRPPVGDVAADKMKCGR